MRMIRYNLEPPVGVITLDRPDRRNALDSEMAGELMEACRAAETDPRCRVILLRAEGPAFCAGMDLRALQMMLSQSYEANLEDSRRLAAVFERLWSFPKPTVAAVQGAALGGGCGLAAICDVTLTTPDAAAWFPGSAHRIRPRNREHFPRTACGSRARARSAPDRPADDGSRSPSDRARERGRVARCPGPARARRRGRIRGEQPAGHGGHEAPAAGDLPGRTGAGVRRQRERPDDRRLPRRRASIPGETPALLDVIRLRAVCVSP